MAYSAPTTRADGYVVDAAEWNKNTVDNPSALRTGAIAIASQAANDIIYASSATQFARLAAGTAGQVLQTNGIGSAPSWVSPSTALGLCGGRLTLTTGTPVTSTDVTAATTLYYALYAGNQIALYTGSAWQAFSISELSIAVPSTTSQMYDVFVDYNSGTPALAVVAWTNDTTRATALTKQDGVYVLSGTTTKRYVGSFRTTSVSGQTEDSAAKRFVWNYYNRVSRPMRVQDTTNTWTYSTAAFRQANNSAANQLSIVQGVAEDAISVQVQGYAYNSASGVNAFVSIGQDSTSAKGADVISTGAPAPALNVATQIQAYLNTTPAVGYHYYAWLEYDATGGGTTTWVGDNGGSLVQTGITGMWRA